MGVSRNGGTPKWMVKIMENPIKMDDLGGFPPILGHTDIQTNKKSKIQMLSKNIKDSFSGFHHCGYLGVFPHLVNLLECECFGYHWM